MRVLIVTKIFPNAVEPDFAPYNRLQFAALGRRCDVEVFGTIPYLPGGGALRRWLPAGRLAGAPREERIDGLRVRHPRFLHVPKLLSLHGALYAASLAPHVLPYRGKVDVVLGAFAYPDGFASVLLGQLLGVPTVVKLHGGDINVGAKLPGPHKNLRWALPRARRIVAVSEPLAEAVGAFGVPRDRVDVVYNGVDRAVFRPRDRAAARAALGLPREAQVLVSVGRLEKRKGVFELIEAYGALRRELPSARLVMIGDGEDADACRAAAERVGGEIAFPGALGHAKVAEWMAASDAVTLPSWNEGTPNVLIEALSSGRRVVATRVGGIPHVVHDPRLGELVPARDPSALAAALGRVLRTPYDPERVAALGGRGDWTESAGKLYDSLSRAVAGAPSR